MKLIIVELDNIFKVLLLDNNNIVKRESFISLDFLYNMNINDIEHITVNSCTSHYNEIQKIINHISKKEILISKENLWHCLKEYNHFIDIECSFCYPEAIAYSIINKNSVMYK